MPAMGIDILEATLENILMLITTQYMAGKQLREFNYKALICLCVSTVYFLWFNVYDIPDIWTMMNFVIVLLYILIAFGRGFARSFLILLKMVILVLALQTLCSLPAAFNDYVVIDGRLQGCLINCLCIIIVVVVFEIFSRRQDGWINAIRMNWSVGVVLLVGIAVAYFIVLHKLLGSLGRHDFWMVLLYVVTVVVIAGLWQRMVLANREKEQQIEKLELLEESYREMASALRGRQHEFVNHLSVIQGQHFQYKTYEELVASQEKYIGEIAGSVKFYELLHLKNPALSGLLNLKFGKAEQAGLQVSHEALIQAEELPLQTVELIEIVGALLDNAIDYLMEKEVGDRKLFFKIADKEKFVITVANSIRKEDAAHLSSFFDKGYSTKGKGHGYGLFNLKKLTEKNKGKILMEHKEEEEMLYITVEFAL